MIPINIDTKIAKMDTKQLQDALEYKTYEFCVLADFSKTDAINKLCDTLEQLTVESLMRIFDGKLGYRPLQNKIYEKTEFVFGDQDSYNINRLISSLRRVKLHDINSEDTKYINWVINRAKYASKALIGYMSTVDFGTPVEA